MENITNSTVAKANSCPKFNGTKAVYKVLHTCDKM